MSDAGGTGGPAGNMNGEEPRKPKKPMRGLIIALCIAGGCLAVFLICRAAVQHMNSLLGKSDSSSAQSGGFLPDSEMGYNKIDFTNAVLGEAREQELLVVYEQDVAADTKVSDAFLNWDIFKKTKVIHSYGKGAFTVELSGVASDAIAVDTDKKTVTVSLPRTTLRYLEIDANKTTFEDTEHALLGFGDITLTQEQQQKLDEEIRSAMIAELTTDESFQKADDAGLKKVQQMLQPVISSVSGEFRVNCRYSDAERKDSEAAETDSVPDVPADAS